MTVAPVLADVFEAQNESRLYSMNNDVRDR